MNTYLRRVTIAGVILGCMMLATMGRAAAMTLNQGTSCTDNSSFVKDVTIPDNNRVDSGQTFTKIWRIRNSGTCTWTTDYQFVHVSNNRMGAPAKIKLKERVAPGKNVDISVTFTAPPTAGTHRSTWQLQSSSGTNFGIKPYVQVVVADPLSMLKQEVFFTGVEGGGSYCEDLIDRPSTRHWPEFASMIYDVPWTDNVDVTVKLPNGRVYSQSFYLDEIDSDLENEVTYYYRSSNGGYLANCVARNKGSVMVVPFWVPPGTPIGRWTMTVDSDGVQRKSDFTVEARSGPALEVMNSSLVYNPFAGRGSGKYTVKLGRAVKIVGEGLPNNLSIPIGIYETDEYKGDVRLVAGVVVKSNNQGRFSTIFTTDSRFRRGAFYCLVIPAEAIFTGSQRSEWNSIGINGDICFSVE